MKKIVILSMIMLGIIVGCDRGQGSQREVKKNMAETKETGAVATFAGGCFWCVESDFEKVPGVLKVVSGYTGGTGENPTYETYARQGYVEAVQVFYDPAKITYAQLLDVFWRHIDPTDGGGQFVDRGPHYRSVIFYHDEEQRRLAEKSKEELGKSGRFTKPIVTEIIKFNDSTTRRSITRIITRKTPSVTGTTGTDRGGTSSWRRYGGRRGGGSLNPHRGKSYTKPDDATLRKIADADAVQGHPEGRHRAALPERIR